MKMTKHGTTILNILKTSKTPLSAESLSTLVTKEKMDLSTIYRNLDKLHSAGLISKSVINHTGYYFVSNHDHHHFMICLTCKKVSELDCHIHEFIEEVQAKTDFKVVQHDVTFYGYCSDCQKND